MKVVFTRPTYQDLAEIRTWIAADNPRAADRMVEKLVSACSGLSRFPLRYPEIAARRLRKRPVGSYLIFYRVTDKVEIVRILHAARDWVSLLDEA